MENKELKEFKKILHEVTDTNRFLLFMRKHARRTFSEMGCAIMCKFSHRCGQQIAARNGFEKAEGADAGHT